MKKKPDNTNWDSPIRKMEGASFEDCLEKIRRQYKGRAGYQLLSRRDIPVGGIRGFFSHETKTVVEYIPVVI